MGFSVSVQSLFYTEDLDYQHIGLIFVIGSLMVFDEHKVNARFRCIQSWRGRKNIYYRCKTVSVAHYVMTYHCKAYAKTNYLGRQIILSFLQMKNIGHHCEWSLMVTLSWVVVIRHTIFHMIPVFFWCIAKEFKDWWFNSFTRFLYKDYLLTKYVICSSYLLLFHCV